MCESVSTFPPYCAVHRLRSETAPLEPTDTSAALPNAAHRPIDCNYLRLQCWQKIVAILFGCKISSRP